MEKSLRTNFIELIYVNILHSVCFFHTMRGLWGKGV